LGNHMVIMGFVQYVPDGIDGQDMQYVLIQHDGQIRPDEHL